MQNVLGQSRQAPSRFRHTCTETTIKEDGWELPGRIYQVYDPTVPSLPILRFEYADHYSASMAKDRNQPGFRLQKADRGYQLYECSPRVLKYLRGVVPAFAWRVVIKAVTSWDAPLGPNLLVYFEDTAVWFTPIDMSAPLCTEDTLTLGDIVVSRSRRIQAQTPLDLSSASSLPVWRKLVFALRAYVRPSWLTD